MPLYLGRFSYSTDAMKALINQPQDRSAAAREVAESVGGKLLGFWYAFGEFDGVFLMEAPDNASAAALAMAVGADGALSEVETTVLLDMDEAQDAMRKAATATYRPPGSRALRPPVDEPASERALVAYAAAPLLGGKHRAETCGRTTTMDDRWQRNATPVALPQPHPSRRPIPPLTAEVGPIRLVCASRGDRAADAAHTATS